MLGLAALGLCLHHLMLSAQLDFFLLRNMLLWVELSDLRIRLLTIHFATAQHKCLQPFAFLAILIASRIMQERVILML
jgi:hypothetical protein